MEQVIKHLKILKIILKYKYIVFILIILLSSIRANLYAESKYKTNEKEFYGIIIDYKVKDTSPQKSSYGGFIYSFVK